VAAACDWQQACRASEPILVDHPQDLVALRMAHLSARRRLQPAPQPF